MTRGETAREEEERTREEEAAAAAEAAAEAMRAWRSIHRHRDNPNARQVLVTGSNRGLGLEFVKQLGRSALSVSASGISWHA